MRKVVDWAQVKLGYDLHSVCLSSLPFFFPCIQLGPNFTFIRGSLLFFPTFHNSYKINKNMLEF